MRRPDHRRQGGYCRTCRPLGASPVQALPGGGINLNEWQQLVQQRARKDREAQARREAQRRARQQRRGR
jgi:hypothetical protein